MTTILTEQLQASAPNNEPSCARAARFRPGTLWITWERHRRTRELSASFGAELVELTSRSSPVIRYLNLLWRTTWCLVKQRPTVLLIQCPSVLLAFWAAVLKPVFGYVLVVDLHNEAVEPFIYSGGPYRAALRFVHRAAHLGIVSNDVLKHIVDSSGGRGFVLPDKVPELALPQPAPDERPRAQVVFVCTYAADEPVAEMIEAGGLLDPAVDLHITGDHRRLQAGVAVPANVQLTGYLPEAQYEELLRTADVIVDLTRMENCLVCGAYEAVALEKPLVTSDTQALRRYFSMGAVYSAHTPAALSDAIGRALSQRRRLSAEMATLKRELAVEWASRRNALCTLVEGEAR